MTMILAGAAIKVLAVSEQGLCAVEIVVSYAKKPEDRSPVVKGCVVIRTIS